MPNGFFEWLMFVYFFIGSFGGWIIIVLLGYEALKTARKTRRR